MPHITQIAAVEPQSGSRFNCYVTPKVPISSSAQQDTGIVVSDSGSMTVHGESVEAHTIKSALEKLFTWLSKLSCVFLVAHNGRRFDFPVLVSTIMNLDKVSAMNDCIEGFIDSLPVFKKAFPNQDTYKQEDLARKLLNSSYAAHDAIEDVICLGHLVWHSNLNCEALLLHSFRPNAVVNQLTFNDEKSKNMDSLNPLIYNGVMKRATAENVAGSGLNFNHLKKIFERDGEDGLQSVFTVKNSEGLPRVTSTKRVLEDVIPKLAQYFRK